MSKNPATKRVHVMLPEPLWERLNSDSSGLSVSKLVTKAVEKSFSRTPEESHVLFGELTKLATNEKKKYFATYGDLYRTILWVFHNRKELFSILRRHEDVAGVGEHKK